MDFIEMRSLISKINIIQIFHYHLMKTALFWPCQRIIQFRNKNLFVSIGNIHLTIVIKK